MATYNDGSVPYGFSVEVLWSAAPGGSVTYVMEDLSVDFTSTVIERRDGLGAMTGRVAIDDQATRSGLPAGVAATMTLQRATTSTPIPDVGADLSVPGSPFTNVFVQLGIGNLPSSFRVIGSSASQSQTTAHTFSVRVWFPISA